MPVSVDPRLREGTYAEELQAARAACNDFAARHLDRQLDKYREPAAPRWNYQDLLEAHGEVLDIMAGAPRTGRQFHPLAAELLDAGATPSLENLARSACIMVHGEAARSWSSHDVFAWGSPGVAHLGDILSSVANTFILSRQPSLLALILATTLPREVKDFRPVKAATVELATGIDAATVLDTIPWQTMRPTASAENLQLAKSPVRIRFNEIDVVNDDVGALLETVRAVQIAASQNELETWSALLNADVDMADGDPAFSTTAGNALESGGAPGVDTLNTAFAALRSQILNGKKTDATPRHVLVPDELEATARNAVTAIYGPGGPVSVEVSSYLTGGYWFVLADPVVWPVLVRATMAGAGGQSLSLTPGYPNEREGARDIVLEGAHTYAYGIVSRVGAVRVPTS